MLVVGHVGLGGTVRLQLNQGLTEERQAILQYCCGPLIGQVHFFSACSGVSTHEATLLTDSLRLTRSGHCNGNDSS